MERQIKIFDGKSPFRPDLKQPPKEKPKPIPMSMKPKKKTGEVELFEIIWKKRPHISFVSRTFLGQDAKAWFFAHVLPKGKYPEFRLLEKNIILLTKEEHFIWDNCPRSETFKIQKFKKLFELETELLTEYKNQ